MKEIFQYHPSILNNMIFVLVVFFFIFMVQTFTFAENYAPVQQTGQTHSYATGDDGDLKMGVPWPNPRFTDNGDGTVTDNLTGLIWLKNANCFGGKDWWEALDASNNLADGQYGLSDDSIPGDWHLPNARELLSLINYNNSFMLPSDHPFVNVWINSYVSSTTVASRTEAALHVNVVPELGPDGGSHFGDAPKDQDFRGVWPVRDGDNFLAPASIQQTGQTQSYAAGDDGDLQKGVEWPNTRFTDNSDGTVTDNLTGLVWLKNANCFGGKDWWEALDASNHLADGQCGLSDGSIPGEWRLSNIKELRSLIDHGNDIALLPSGHPFTNVQSDPYWSGTTDASDTNSAWHMPVGESTGHFYGILSSPKDKNPYFPSVLNVWPVRNGDKTPPIHNSANGHSYQRYDNSLTWHDAKTHCESLGGYLATLTSPTEHDFVFNKLGFGAPYGMVWLGAADEEQEGVWQWVTDEAWDFTYWDDGEPLNCAGIEHYLTFFTPNFTPERVGFWNDLGSGNDGGCGCQGCIDSWYPVSTICEWEEPPVIDDIAYSSCISELCTTILVASARAPGGGTLTYAWDEFDDGTVDGTGDTFVFDPPGFSMYPACDPYRIKLTVTSDVSGLKAEQTAEIVVKLAGDANGDGVVNILDKVMVRNAFGTTGPNLADVNCDNVVNILDKVTVRNQFGQNGCACP